MGKGSRIGRNKPDGSNNEANPDEQTPSAQVTSNLNAFLKKKEKKRLILSILQRGCRFKAMPALYRTT